jgi:heat shock protein 4
LKRLAGRTIDDPEVQEIEKNFIMAELADANGQAGVKVKYLKKKKSIAFIRVNNNVLGQLPW